MKTVAWIGPDPPATLGELGVVGCPSADLLPPDVAAVVIDARQNGLAAQAPAIPVLYLIGSDIPESLRSRGNCDWVEGARPGLVADRLARLLENTRLADQEKQLQKDVERLQKLAHHDALTGLPNRALLMDRLERAVGRTQRHGWRTALVLLDLDHFKEINDTLGHDVGDTLLQAVARRFVGCVRRIDTVARLGGDEFTLILENIRKNEDYEYVINRMFRSLEKPIPVGEHRLLVGTSAGVALLDAADRPEDVFKCADIALYKAKEIDGNACVVYSEEIETRAGHSIKLRAELKQAIATRALVLHYQPIVELAGNALIGVEGLLRWPRATGIEAPGNFIPTLEETGWILEVGDQILDMACAARVRWQGVPPATAINLSSRQLRDDGVADRFAAILASHGVAAGEFELEVTETHLMYDQERVRKNLTRLADMGFRIALDDFGTGYSALSYLREFPVSTLKLDRSFVSALPAGAKETAIVQALIRLAHRLGLKVVAEGIENAAQFQFLVDEGCHAGQGYWICRPQPEADLRRWIEGR
jgi:diguanylate cyclase (GGDEF)-like protein